MAVGLKQRAGSKKCASQVRGWFLKAGCGLTPFAAGRVPLRFTRATEGDRWALNLQHKRRLINHTNRCIFIVDTKGDMPYAHKSSKMGQ